MYPVCHCVMKCFEKRKLFSKDRESLFYAKASQNYLATNKRKDLGDFAEENLKHELNVLLKRGVHGLYLFAVDEGLQQRLKECCIH